MQSYGLPSLDISFRIGAVIHERFQECDAQLADGIGHQLVERREAGRDILRPRLASKHAALREPLRPGPGMEKKPHCQSSSEYAVLSALCQLA